ncbi:sensor histidine kinase [Salmonirosea aquatica]|uniref:Signal transduction histidine kinase internal region domain-containing protein n=1 Tax=Salmonirosea aquatica TaxID=2654236 RepID=A0A7C9BE78_9BACT|nr:hypothetical protein [Cytophagaceae bacterium SJW1-29]
MTLSIEQKIRLAGPILLFLIGTLFFRLNWYFELPTGELIRSDIIGLTAGYLCWNLTRWVVQRLQIRFPGLTNTRRRLLWMGLLLPLLVNIAWLLRQFLHIGFNDASYIWVSVSAYTYALGIQIFYHGIYYTIYEGGYVLQEWQRSYEHNEWLKKNKLQHQLETLKSQINPHFLFNSLNSLSMLIHDNPRQAEAFVDEISNVYRYLLRANEQPLTTLRRELQFIQSYFQLLKTRYGPGIDLRILVEAEQLEAKIPPLTLQLLVENAVKHNAVLPEQPLMVLIEARGQYLEVRNNLNRKNSTLQSNRVGLANISAKYTLLSSQSISVREEDGYFVVTLPLLAFESQTYPGI